MQKRIPRPERLRWSVCALRRCICCAFDLGHPILLGYPDNTNKVLAIIGTGGHNRFQVPKVMQTFRFVLAASNLRIITLLAAAVLLAEGCSKRAAHSAWTSSESMVIEPGVSIGPVRDGMTIQRVVAELGEPDRKEGSALEYLNLGLSVIGRDGVARTVLCVEPSGQDGPGSPPAGSEKKGPFTKAFAGHTKEGIGIGSSRAEVIHAYGEPTATEAAGDGWPNFEVLRYRPLGLYLRLRDGRVDTIGVIFQTRK